MAFKKGETSGAKNVRWKGGVKIHAYGYRLIATPEHPFKDKQGYVREHRLVIEKSLGRYLNPEEDVHHLDGNKKNNDISNLVLMASRSEHLKTYHKEDGIKHGFKKGHSLTPKTGTNKVCIICKKLFWVYKSARPTKRFCSIACKAQSQKGKWHGTYNTSFI